MSPLAKTLRLQDESVSDCKVVQTADKTKIVAHLILNGNCTNTEQIIERIHKHCCDNLDEYALPTHYKIRDVFPVHSNGKRNNESLKKDTESLISV